MHGNPEELVEPVQVWPRLSSLQHGELLPEHEVLNYEIPAATKEASEGSEAEQKHVEHHRSYSDSYNGTLAVGWPLCYSFQSR
jgi:hypothetical protein